jgi:hypothetical protein
MINQSTPTREQALLRVTLRGAIARASDEQLEQTSIKYLAQQLATTGLDPSQVRNLENLAYTTDKVSDITDLLKKLVGRDGQRKKWANDNVGQELIAALEALRVEADKIVTNIPDQLRGAVDADLPRRVHLELCREFVKHLAAEFLYKTKVKDRGV